VRPLIKGTHALPTTGVSLDELVEAILGQNGKDWLEQRMSPDPGYYLRMLNDFEAIRHPTGVLQTILVDGDEAFFQPFRQDETDPRLVSDFEAWTPDERAAYWAIGAMAQTDLEPHAIVAWARGVALVMWERQVAADRRAARDFSGCDRHPKLVSTSKFR
jgi:hypothetical protein